MLLKQNGHLQEGLTGAAFDSFHVHQSGTLLSAHTPHPPSGFAGAILNELIVLHLPDCHPSDDTGCACSSVQAHEGAGEGAAGAGQRGPAAGRAA